MKKRTLRPKYSQLLLYFSLIVIVVVAMVFTRRCSSATPLPPVVKGASGGDTIDVAVIYGPMSYYMYDDTIGGVNYDMLRKFAGDSDKEIKMWPVVNLHDALLKIEDGTFDILASLPADNDVKKRFNTTESVFLDRLVLVQTADSAGNTAVKSALDLAGDTVRIQKDSPASGRLANLSNEIGAEIHVRKEEKLSEEYLCMKVANGEFKYAVVNEKVAEKMKLKYPNLSYDNPVSFTQFQVWILPKGDTAVLRSLNSWISDFVKSPDYQSIIKKYNSPTP
ncbi:MAG: transporter substrate-binding domain-containing protein [Muribaculaceae bacterium]|nr:transporter substrate-binding domain-containing protein [Muribaculaceae bacterium]